MDVVASHDLRPLESTITNLQKRDDVARNVCTARRAIGVWQIRPTIPQLKYDLPSCRIGSKRLEGSADLINTEVLSKAVAVRPGVHRAFPLEFRQARKPVVEDARIIAPCKNPHNFCDGECRVDRRLAG